MLTGPRRLALPDALPAPAVQAGRLDHADRVRAALDVEGQARRADDAVRRVAHEVLPPRHVEPPSLGVGLPRPVVLLLPAELRGVRRLTASRARLVTSRAATATSAASACTERRRMSFQFSKAATPPWAWR